MRLVIIIALAIFWLVLAVRAFERGDMVLAGVYIIIGIALTVYRLKK
jgi:hypothetical protein